MLQHFRLLATPSPNIYASYPPSLGGGDGGDIDGDGDGSDGRNVAHKPLL